MSRLTAIIIASLAPFAAFAGEPDRCVAAITDAQAEVASAKATVATAPKDARAVAIALLASAQEQLRTALARCQPEELPDTTTAELWLVDDDAAADPFDETTPIRVVTGFPLLTWPSIAMRCLPGEDVASCPVAVVPSMKFTAQK